MLLARAILDAPLQLAEGVQPGNQMQEVMEAYIQSIFPYHEADNKKDIREMTAALNKWVSSIDHITVTPIVSAPEQFKQVQRIHRANTELENYNKRLSSMVRRRLT